MLLYRLLRPVALVVVNTNVVVGEVTVNAPRWMDSEFVAVRIFAEIDLVSETDWM